MHIRDGGTAPPTGFDPIRRTANVNSGRRPTHAKVFRFGSYGELTIFAVVVKFLGRELQAQNDLVVRARFSGGQGNARLDLLDRG